MSKFLDGLYVKAPNEKAPEFVKCKISININKLQSALSEIQDEWVNLDVKVSKDGKMYAQIDDWKPTKSADPHAREEVPRDDFVDSEIPF